MIIYMRDVLIGIVVNDMSQDDTEKCSIESVIDKWETFKIIRLIHTYRREHKRIE